MNVLSFVLLVILVVVVYKVVDVTLMRYERLKAMQRLEGEQLVTYLGKSEPKVARDYLDMTIWWLLRAASVVIGIGIPFATSPWFYQLHEKRSVGEMSMVGCMFLLGAIMLIIELIFERKVRNK